MTSTPASASIWDDSNCTVEEEYTSASSLNNVTHSLTMKNTFSHQNFKISQSELEESDHSSVSSNEDSLLWAPESSEDLSTSDEGVLVQVELA